MKHLVPWFELKRVPGIGNLLFKRLIDRFGSPERVFAASIDNLCKTEGVSRHIAEAIRSRASDPALEREIKTPLDKGYRIVTLADAGYPPMLREIPDPPPILYMHGSPEDVSGVSIAVVGSRKATPYGLAAARSLCRDLAARGVTIVSGMAKGIDAAAHLGALEAGGKTAAVLGSGLDRIYPRENRKLFFDISRNGAVITEFDLAAGPEAHHFPARNRIISGMSMGTVVVEATRKSGSLITARMAAEQNREVFAVPGSIQSAASAGTHALIKQGAKLAACVEDILEEFDYLFNETPESVPAVHNRRLPALSQREHFVVEHMGHHPSHIDDIIRKTELAPGELSSILLRLELMGIISQSPGKFFFLSA